MSTFGITDDMYSRMDPDVAKILEEAKQDFAESIKNPAQSSNDMWARAKALEPAAIIDRDQQSEDHEFQPAQMYTGEDDRRSSNSFQQFGDAQRYTENQNDASSIRLDEPIKLTQKEQDEQQAIKKRYVVEIDTFAKALNLSNTIPSTLEMMSMSYKTVEHMWMIWDERYNRDQTQFVLRNGLALIGIMLGFGADKIVRLFRKDSIMDMNQWATSWWVDVTTDRPGYTPPFDLSLMILMRRLGNLRDFAPGEGALIMGFIRHLYKEYRTQQAAKKEAQEKEDAMEERIRKKVFAGFEDRLKNSTYVPPPPESVSDSGESQKSEDVHDEAETEPQAESLLSKFTFDQDDDEEKTTNDTRSDSGEIKVTDDIAKPENDATEHEDMASTQLETETDDISEYANTEVPTTVSGISTTQATKRRGRPRKPKVTQDVVDLDDE